MKLKNLLVLAFLTLTLIPIGVISVLLYKSGYELSKASYTSNLAESLRIQEDYLLQILETNMVSDLRLVTRTRELLNNKSSLSREQLLSALQPYLEASEDKISICILLNRENKPVYTMGDQNLLKATLAQLPDPSSLAKQEIRELEPEHGAYSLAIMTPAWASDGTYEGCLVSVYSKYYIFKIISSYYKIADSSTYLCRADGTVISFQALDNEKRNNAIKETMSTHTLSASGSLDMTIGKTEVFGYYINIRNTPWFLVGFVDDALIYSFTNRFVLAYLLIVMGVCVADVLLAFYFSHKVVKPINSLIKVMEAYQNSLNKEIPTHDEKHSYFEIQYLRTKFSDLMKTIMLVQHNFEGIYYLYQSSNMGDINIDIDVKLQTIASNKDVFQALINELEVPKEACIVDKFIKCFADEDQKRLLTILESMRDKHLSGACEVEVYTPYLSQRWFHALVVPLYENDRLARFFVQLRDISTFKRQEIESRERAQRDSLTGLYNRSGFLSRVNRRVHEKPDAQTHSLLFLDMNFFKMVNDSLGHKAGDELLCNVGQIIEECIGERGIVSRFGGDEFAVFLPCASAEKTEQIRQELTQRLVFPFHTPQQSFVVSASIGSAQWIRGTTFSLELLLQSADSTMYDTKRHFKQNCPAFPDPANQSFSL